MAHEEEIFGINQKLLLNDVIGIAYKDTMNFELHKYGRETTIEHTMFVANYDSSLALQSTFDGYLGLAPYSAMPDNKEYSFVWQLKNKGLIDHMVVSVYAEVADVAN